MAVTADQLAGLPMLEGSPTWALKELAAQAEEHTLPAGAFVVEQHEPAETVWVLLDGSVQILLRFGTVGDLVVGVQTEPGSIIGWSAFREPHVYTDSARCEQECRLVSITREGLERVFERDGLVGAQILRRVAGTLDDRMEGAMRFLTQDQPLEGL